MLWTAKVVPLLRRRAMSSSEYWNRHTVAVSDFTTSDKSLSYLRWRNDQYRGYIDLMPVNGHDGEVVLDYGCGPGHDLVGIGHYSSPSRLLGCDVSPKALSVARTRLDLHDATVELVQISEIEQRLPFDDSSIDYIHSSGVLHHVPDPVAVLREFGRILKPGGYSRVMVYNYNSVWLHLYVAHQMQLVERKYTDLEIRDAFSKTTDGRFCPIAEVWTPPEFIEIARRAGLSARLQGCAVSMHEMSLLPTRSAAIGNPLLRDESREFLSELTFDPDGLPMTNGQLAGVDAVFELRRDQS